MIAVIVQLLACGVQLLLLTKADQTGTILDVARHTWFIFIIPTVTLLIIRVTQGKDVAAFGAFPVYIISFVIICVAVVLKTNNPEAIFRASADTFLMPFLKMTAVYILLGFLPSAIMTSILTDKEKLLEENKLKEKNYL
jgi:hypothetical protein